MRQRLKFGQTFFIIIMVSVIFALTFAFYENRKELTEEKEQEQPVTSKSRVNVINGHNIIALDQALQIKNGIVSEPLKAASLPNKIIIPLASIVWFDGKAWVYVQIDKEHFVRHEVPTKAPIKNCRVVINGFLPGERVVVVGAQLLLSEEFQSSIQVGD